jgi:hypothetical protein
VDEIAVIARTEQGVDPGSIVSTVVGSNRFTTRPDRSTRNFRSSSEWPTCPASLALATSATQITDARAAVHVDLVEQGKRDVDLSQNAWTSSMVPGSVWPIGCTGTPAPRTPAP